MNTPAPLYSLVWPLPVAVQMPYVEIPFITCAPSRDAKLVDVKPKP